MAAPIELGLAVALVSIRACGVAPSPQMMLRSAEVTQHRLLVAVEWVPARKLAAKPDLDASVVGWPGARRAKWNVAVVCEKAPPGLPAKPASGRALASAFSTSFVAVAAWLLASHRPKPPFGQKVLVCNFLDIYSAIGRHH